ncbi:hypothetical protein L2E82_53146 [Cichorium intybus]|nr:hypothetical protein L2E82_53146 [Cichorium intybus]
MWRYPSTASFLEGLWPLGHGSLQANITQIIAIVGLQRGIPSKRESSARNPVNHRVFERKLRPKPSGRGHACLGVTHRVAPTMHPLSGHMAIGAEIGLPVLMVRRCSRTATPVRRDYPLSLSISISGGKETYKDSLSLEKRPQRRTGPKSPGRGAPERVRAPSCPDPVATTRRCLRVGLFGNAAPMGGKFPSKAKYPRRETDSKQVPRGKDEKDFEKRVKECLKLSGREANGAGDGVPVGCGTAIAGPPIDSGRGPVRIGAAAKARAVVRLVEMPSRRSWLAARARLGDIPACSRHRPVGTPFGPS